MGHCDACSAGPGLLLPIPFGCTCCTAGLGPAHLLAMVLGSPWLPGALVLLMFCPPGREDQGLFPGAADLPSYARELRYGSEQHPIR